MSRLRTSWWFTTNTSYGLNTFILSKAVKVVVGTDTASFTECGLGQPDGDLFGTTGNQLARRMVMLPLTVRARTLSFSSLSSAG